jgi:hypothetical protein
MFRAWKSRIQNKSSNLVEYLKFERKKQEEKKTNEFGCGPSPSFSIHATLVLCDPTV